MRYDIDPAPRVCSVGDKRYRVGVPLRRMDGPLLAHACAMDRPLHRERGNRRHAALPHRREHRRSCARGGRRRRPCGSKRRSGVLPSLEGGQGEARRGELPGERASQTRHGPQGQPFRHRPRNLVRIHRHHGVVPRPPCHPDRGNRGYHQLLCRVFLGATPNENELDDGISATYHHTAHRRRATLRSVLQRSGTHRMRSRGHRRLLLRYAHGVDGTTPRTTTAGSASSPSPTARCTASRTPVRRASSQNKTGHRPQPCQPSPLQKKRGCRSTRARSGEPCSPPAFD